MKTITVALALAIMLTLALVTVAGAQGPTAYFNGGTFYGYSSQTNYLDGYFPGCSGWAYPFPGNSDGAFDRFGGGYSPPYQRFGGGYMYGPYLRFGGGYGVTPYTVGWNYPGY